MSAAIDVARAVANAEDLNAIHEITHCYGYFIDKGLWADLCDMFTESGEVHYSSGPFRGIAEVTRYFFDVFGQGRTGLPRERLANHIMMQGVVTIAPSGTEARGHWRSLIQNLHPAQPVNWSEGQYAFFYVKQDGRWMIRAIRWTPQLQARYAPEPLPGSEASGSDRLFTAPYAPPTLLEFSPAAQRAAVPDRRALDGRLVRLADRQAIVELQNGFGYFLDRKLWKKAEQLFSPQATYIAGDGSVFRGADIHAGLSAGEAEGLKYGDLFNHMQLMPVVVVARGGRRASGRWRFLAQLSDRGRRARWSEGVYENHYIKIGSRWRIERHCVYVNSITPRDAADWSVRDSQAQAEGAPFPDFSVPPFSFKNPVTGRPIQIPQGRQQ